MKKTIEKFGIPILMVFIVIIYILNNISGVEDKLIIVNYSIIFFNFIQFFLYFYYLYYLNHIKIFFQIQFFFLESN